MVDPASLNRIIDAADISKEDTVIEIGTGSGILTKEISKKANKVISFEIDKRIFEVAKEYLRGIDNIDLRNEDFLRADLKDVSKAKVVANVPYYITTPIIERIFENKALFSTVTLTVQREFAERMAARSGTKQYGSFTIFVNYHTEPKIAFYIPRSAFLPQPDVGSAVICMDIRKKPKVTVKDEKIFFEMVRAAFGQRRKTLRNALLSKFDSELVDKALSGSGIDGKRRGETLSIEEFGMLANEVS